MATLSTYKTIVQNEVDDSSARAGTIIEQAIQDTYQEILQFTGEYLAGTTEEDITATVDQRYVTPVTNTFQDIKSVLWKNTGTTSYASLNKNYDEDDYYREDVNRDSGDPTKYYLNGSNIYFDLAPSTAGTVRISGVAVQDELVGSVTSVIPERHERVLILGAVMRFKMYEGLQDAREYESQYRGPYFKQGKIGGALKNMIEELRTNIPIPRPALFGKR